MCVRVRENVLSVSVSVLPCLRECINNASVLLDVRLCSCQASVTCGSLLGSQIGLLSRALYASGRVK